MTSPAASVESHSSATAGRAMDLAIRSSWSRSVALAAAQLLLVIIERELRRAKHQRNERHLALLIILKVIGTRHARIDPLLAHSIWLRSGKSGQCRV
jgi:hypothetical protein